MTIVVDRSAWGRLRVTGGDRVRFLQGLTTVNVEALADGSHGWGAILSPKGRVLAVINIAHRGDGFVVACEPGIADKVRGILERYAVMDDVAFEPIGERPEEPQAKDASRSIKGPAHQIWPDVRGVWAGGITEGAHPDARPETDAAAEHLRLRAGFLRYGVDVGEDHFPFETPLAGLLDYGKGCYVGQEPVFRVHAQGNAARTLRLLVVEGAAPVAGGTPVAHPAKDNAGLVTSSALAEDGASVLALAYLHRTTWEPGGTVTVAGRAARVLELPA